jgi:hypothetical protein
MLRGRLGSNRDLVDERTKGGIAKIDDVELFCLQWSRELLSYRWRSLRACGGVEFQHLDPDVANVLGCLVLYLWG